MLTVSVCEVVNGHHIYRPVYRTTRQVAGTTRSVSRDSEGMQSASNPTDTRVGRMVLGKN